MVQSNAVAPRYFETVGVALLAGRDIGPRDSGNEPPVAIVNHALARFLFPGENPVGRSLQVDGRAGKDPWGMTFVLRTLPGVDPHGRGR